MFPDYVMSNALPNKGREVRRLKKRFQWMRRQSIVNSNVEVDQLRLAYGEGVLSYEQLLGQDILLRRRMGFLSTKNTIICVLTMTISSNCAQ